MKFASISKVLEKVSALPQADEDTVAQVRDHQLQLTKPPGSLGRLEELAEVPVETLLARRHDKFRGMGTVVEG